MSSPCPTKVAIALALAILPAAVACSSGEAVDAAPSLSDEAAGEDTAQAPIINGQRDPAHPAVMALSIRHTDGSYGICTGTMVKVDAASSIGYVLTAAHCLRDLDTVTTIQGTDFRGPDVVRFPLLDARSHPRYNGQTTSPYDVGMLRVLGVDARTPVIPMRSPDGLANGTRVTSVGFGRIVRPPSTPATQNTVKYRLDGAVSSVGQASLSVRYGNSGSICSGDSGGPVLSTVNGQEFVVGVHSYEVNGCRGNGSVRAAVHDAFFQGIMVQPAPAPTCELCKKTVQAGAMACAVANARCRNDASCRSYWDCSSACSADGGAAGFDAGADAGSAVSICIRSCRERFPLGVGPYVAAANCTCGQSQCAAACSGDALCEDRPTCGMSVGNATCTTCMEGSCCAATAACTADGACYQCSKSVTPAPECASNALFQALTSCKTTSCGAACTPAAP